MPMLIARYKNKKLHSYIIRKGNSFSIGRLPDNHIVIDNVAVSGKHAKIISKGDVFYIEDLNSTNGTFIDKKRIDSRRLKDNDIISIGKHELVFQLKDADDLEPVGLPKSTNGMTSRDRTSALDTIGYQEIMAKNIADANKATLLIMKFKGKQIRKYILKPGKELVIGRLPDNNIVIENDAVSGTHAIIKSKEDDYYIQDLDSTNGTFVNKKRINSHRLKDEDVVSIGKHELVFCLYEKYTMEETLLPYESGVMYATDATRFVEGLTYRKSASQGIDSNHRPVKKNAYLSFLKGGKGDVLIKNKGIEIGKGPDADIFLKGFMVGNTRVMISNTEGGYYLSCRGDYKKIKVNNNPIKGPVKLTDSDTIKIGSLQLAFHNP